MNDTLKNEKSTGYIQKHEVVKIRLTPGEYEEIEKRFGVGSVQTRIEQLVHDKLWHDDEPWIEF